jgi:hypothetical protein
MFGTDQGLMIMLASAFLRKREDPSKLLRGLFASMHQTRALPQKKNTMGQEERNPMRREKPVLVSQPTDLESSLKRDQADLTLAYRYGSFKRQLRRSKGRKQLILPLARTYSGYRSRSGLVQALQNAEAHLQTFCPPAAAYSLSWADLHCVRK